MHRALFVMVLLAGCSFPPEHCGEVQERATGDWLAPSVVASSALPAYDVRVASTLQREWDAAYTTSACGMAVRQGEPSPWSGPVLRPLERDAVDVLLIERSVEANTIPFEGNWSVTLAADSDVVRVEPARWEGPVSGEVHAGFLVEGLREGKTRVEIRVGLPGEEASDIVRSLEYVVNATAGPPHRVDP